MLASSFQLIVKRAWAHWRLLTAVVVGVLLAVTIMATSSVYFDSLRASGLMHGAVFGRIAGANAAAG